MRADSTQKHIRSILRNTEYICNGIHDCLAPDLLKLTSSYHFWMGRRKFILNELLRIQIKEFRHD